MKADPELFAADPVLGRLQRLVVDGHGSRDAVVYAGTPVMTYQQLMFRVFDVGFALAARGVGPGSMVALHLDRSPELIVGMLATWAVGAAWVPLLPEWPEARSRLILDETGARIALVAASPAPWLAACCQTLDVRTPDGRGKPSGGGQRRAYVIYTSGSTGQPKGVVVPHRGLVPMLDAQIAAFELRAGDRCLWMLSPGFDASVSDVGTALLAGATLCIEEPSRLRGPRELLDVIRERGITHVDLPPALLPLLPVEPPPSLRTIIVGGEVCAPAAIRAWASRVRVVNVYGPTEATVCTSLIQCDPSWDRPLLGRPLPHVEYAVVDDELWITGAIAEGYLNRPELTASKFVERDGRRWFRTGDRVRGQGDQLEFVGRIDRQVKIAGVLVAPEEIEARLREHPHIRDAHVVAERVGTRERLVAYYVADAELQLREHLANQLDARLIPSRFTRVDDLGSAKRTTPENNGTEMGGPFEGAAAELREIWSRLLGVQPALDDDFFELGGDSLAVIECVGLAELAGLAMTAELLYEHRTLRALAVAIDRDASPIAMSCTELVADVAVLRDTWRAVRRASRPPSAPVEDSIVLTGATGFLGSRVLVELVERSHVSITCIVRDPRALIAVLRELDASPSERGRAMPGRSRVRVIAGDLTRSSLGLPPSLHDELAATTTAFVHCAADVSLAKPYRALRATNVDGTARILELAAIHGARVHHASTLSVFVGSDRAPGTLREIDELETAGRLHGGYAQSKWAAEWLAREAGATIYRLGLLTGDMRTARAPSRDWLTWFLRGLAGIGAVPRGIGDLAVDLTPVDHAASVLAQLVVDDARGTFHVANRRAARLSDLVAALRRAGIELAEVDDWADTVAAANLEAPEAAAAILGLCRRSDYARLRSCDVFQATGFAFDTSRTDEVAPCPAPTAELLDRYVAAALR